MTPAGSVQTAVRLTAAALLAVLLSGCGSATAAACPASVRVDLAQIDPTDESLPFRLPLDSVEAQTREADFCEHRGPASGGPSGMFHAAEDYYRPAGTAVYAMADGQVSYSGTMDGYGWLVIVDHPDMNLYSLYGHLSPSRWSAELGPVAKGDLIGYLGDGWENGGSLDAPLVTHLHLGVRAGQRSDYSGKGEWRWMAGWINLCPAELGWLQPSAVIADQAVPEGGFAGPAGGLLERWWTEVVLVAAVLAGGSWWIAVGIRRRRTAWLIFTAVLLGALAWFLALRSFALVFPVLVAASASLLAAGLVRIWHLRSSRAP